MVDNWSPAGEPGTGYAGPFVIVDVNAMRPLPDVPLPAGSGGVAVVVRWGHRPVGFLMEQTADRDAVPAAELATMISRACGSKLLQESIRDELRPPLRPARGIAVSIAICTRDRPEHLERCLGSLRNLHLPSEDAARRIEIVVVDNKPSDRRTREVCGRFPEVRYVRENKAGLNFARNRALAEATGEFLSFLDDDVTVDRWWLDGLYEALRENPDAGAVTGAVLPYELATPAQILFERRGGFRRGFEKVRYHSASMPGNRWYPSGAGTFGAGCNMALRRSLLLDLGGFDDALDTGPPLPGGGDLDIFYRVVRAGHPLVYEPRFLVFHDHRREIEKLRRQYWSWGLGFMAFLAKTYRTDPAQRANLRGMVRWWFGDQLRQLLDGVRGRHVLPARFLAAELFGGVVGLAGTYARSVRRTERIRRTAS
jgi:GT2 family glycosyltransferase